VVEQMAGFSEREAWNARGSSVPEHVGAKLVVRLSAVAEKELLAALRAAFAGHAAEFRVSDGMAYVSGVVVKAKSSA
jgi:hypothetical protein